MMSDHVAKTVIFDGPGMVINLAGRMWLVRSCGAPMGLGRNNPSLQTRVLKTLLGIYYQEVTSGEQ